LATNLRIPELAVNENMEQDLLHLVAAGDEGAFKDLYHSYRDKLFFFILRITSSEAMAEDAVQDVFLKVWQKRLDLPSINSFSAYLYRMAHNHVISGLRRMARETEVLSEIRQEMQDEGREVDEALLFRQVQEKLQEIVKGLPRQQRLVYTMSREEGRRQEEIASSLNISPSTVKNHMTEALKTIRREMARFYPYSFVAIMVLLDFRKG
jgi:RNA polymerase sigma-70 factor (family 1)